MAVVKTTSAGKAFVIYTGSIDEVVNAMEADKFNRISEAKIFYNGTNMTGIMLKRG